MRNRVVMNYQSQYSRIGKHYCCTEDKLTTNESNIQIGLSSVIFLKICYLWATKA